jgi:hypothetical protein
MGRRHDLSVCGQDDHNRIQTQYSSKETLGHQTPSAKFTLDMPQSPVKHVISRQIDSAASMLNAIARSRSL